MADDENGQNPQPGDSQQPDQAMEVIRQLITHEVSELVGAVEQRLAQQLQQGLQAIQQKVDQQAQTQAQGEQAPMALSDGGGVSEKELLYGKLFNLLDQPSQLGEIAQAISGVRQAFRGPDDFQLVREVAARNPAAVMLHAPDPLGGKFPELFTNILTRGIQIGSSGKAGQNPFAPAPAVPEPSPSGSSTASPPAPSNGAGGAVSLGQDFLSLDNDTIDDLVGQLMTIKVQRAAA